MVASGNYVAGGAIEFAGASFSINGAPADGDNFNLAPRPGRICLPP